MSVFGNIRTENEMMNTIAIINSPTRYIRLDTHGGAHEPSAKRCVHEQSTMIVMIHGRADKRLVLNDIRQHTRFSNRVEDITYIIPL